jgi:hypothetical protein
LAATQPQNPQRCNAYICGFALIATAKSERNFDHVIYRQILRIFYIIRISATDHPKVPFHSNTFSEPCATLLLFAPYKYHRYAKKFNLENQVILLKAIYIVTFLTYHYIEQLT